MTRSGSRLTAVCRKNAHANAGELSPLPRAHTSAPTPWPTPIARTFFPHERNHPSSSYLTVTCRLFQASRSQLRISFHPSHLPLAPSITAVVPRRRRDGDAGAVVRRAGYLSRDRNLRASNGCPFPPPPTFSVRLMCFAAFCPQALV